MWPKSYKDYSKTSPLIKNQVEPGKGIVGCEMHDFNGWSEEFHIDKQHPPGLLRTLLSRIFPKKSSKES